MAARGQNVHPTLRAVAERIVARSAVSREAYLAGIMQMQKDMPPRKSLSCSNLAHVVAACPAHEKAGIAGALAPNIGIVTSYNDMLSAHQPLEAYPAIIKAAARAHGATAQVAGGVPAMCDGVTQGQAGMELSLFSRDVIAMAAAISLAHNAFDAVLMLGVCDKIVPGLVIAALTFGHLPTVFVPAGPMPTGQSNEDKSRIREAFAAGTVSQAALLDAEMRSYHAPGTCTFYGSANSNQMLMEIMGLHVPGSAFIPPGTGLRDAMTRRAVDLALARAAAGAESGLGRMVSAKTFVNGIAGLMATGGSTNHLIHLVAMARSAGFIVTWEDFADVAGCVPLLARIYPNGPADVNQFHAAGGLAVVIRNMLDSGLLFADVGTVNGTGLEAYACHAELNNDSIVWRPAQPVSSHPGIIRPAADPFQATGGLAVVNGNLGRGIIKTSAVSPDRHSITAPVRVFGTQDAFQSAFRAGDITGNAVIVLPGQGPMANGMPELHGLMPPLLVLQSRGQKVALLTDGRLSGASGKILSALHVTPEAAAGGLIGQLRDGDLVTLDAAKGILQVHVPEEELLRRWPLATPDTGAMHGLGRELFARMRQCVRPADEGADVLWG